MYATQYLLFVVLSFVTPKFLLAGQWGNHESIFNKYKPQGKQSQGYYVCQQCDDKSLSFYAASTEEWTVTLTETSLEVTPPDAAKTNGTITGGAFGSDLYKYAKFLYRWGYYDWSVIFEIQIFYYNTKYETFDNALHYPDGIIQVFVPVDANGKVDNPLFVKFLEELKVIKKTGDSSTFPSLSTFNWYKNFPSAAEYGYFRSSYYEEGSKSPKSCATTLELPPETELNFISRKQFDATLGRLLNSHGNLINVTIPPKDEPKCIPKIEKGIKVTLI